jgi:hypothetical protein
VVTNNLNIKIQKRIELQILPGAPKALKTLKQGSRGRLLHGAVAGSSAAVFVHNPCTNTVCLSG